jgi:PAS domain S-box-containing protein
MDEREAHAAGPAGLFYAAFKASPIGIALENLEGQLLFVNPALCSMLGFSEEEMRRKHRVDFSPPEDAAKDWVLFEQLRAGAIDHYQIEKRFFRCDASLIWGRLSVSRLSGAPPMVVAMVEDITEKRRAQDDLELVAKEMAVSVARCSRDFRYLWANQGYANWLQRPLDEIVGQPILEVLGKEAFESLRHHFARVLAGDKVNHEEEENFQGIGKRWVSAAYTPTFDADGVADGWVAVVVDITAHKNAEKSLKLFRTLVDQSNDAIEVVDPQTLRFLDVNETACRVLGYAREELMTLKVLDIDPTVDPSMKAGIESELRHSGFAIREGLHRRKDGSTFPVELSMKLVQLDRPYVVVAARDITERKRAEEAPKESETRFRLVADTAPVMIWMSSTDKLCSYFNKPWLDFTGRSIEQELGNGWADGVHPEDLRRCLDTYGQSFDRRQEFSMEYRLRRHDGEYPWILDIGVPRFNQDGSFAGYIGSCLDVTQRKQAESVLTGLSRKLIEAQDQERARIARDLHDDIGQRLALLAVGFDQIQQDAPALPPEALNQMSELRKQTVELSTDVQTMSHALHAPKLEYLGLVSTMRIICSEFGERQRVEIDFSSHDVPTSLSQEISLCLIRVLQEALQNAAKHSGVRHAEVELRGTPDEIHLRVRDLGKGFDLNAAMQGRGLGLTSMQERVRLLNGTVLIQSEPMGGTTVQVRIPVRAAHTSQRAVR